VADVEVGRYRIPESDLSWRFSRSSGPGGQSVNTSDSRVQLSFDLAGSRLLSPHVRDRALERLSAQLVDGVLTIAASEHRSQWRNRQAALVRLEALLDQATAPGHPTRRPTRPSRSSQRRRLETKRTRGETKRGRRRPGADQ
jgi:ribosome-associated protein